MSYEARRKELFYERTNVNKINKQYVTEFFEEYNCAKSTEGRFYAWLPYFLSKTDNVKVTMLDNTAMTKIFNDLHKKLSPAAYRTVQTTVKTFCKVLNGGEAPEAFKHIKYLTKQEKKKLARVNKPDYKTLSWEDGLNMAEQTKSMQYKALILTELDGGFRPGELEALNYGDCKKDGKFIICHVKQSKTAEKRDVVIYRAASYLNRWLQLHPTRKAKDPLWIMQNHNMSSLYRKNPKVMRLSYDAMRQNIRRIGRNAGLGTISMYMIRHSAVSLAKQERLGIDLAAEKFGHDINYYINTYGKLSTEQKINRFKGHYGEEEEQEKAQPKNQVCPVCETINEPDIELCEKCSSPLSLKKALELEKGKDAKIDKLQEQMKSFMAKEKRVENKFNMLIEAFASGKLKKEKVKELMGK